MGKLNEIQQEATQSWGSNSFTTTIKEDTVEFDSVKDKFTFKDEVEVPSLKVNGESVSSQVQSDWNQNDNTKADYIKNKPTIPSAQVQSDWNQSDSEAVDYIKNKPTITPQVQADWNQNDNTASDYIKNRICYSETSGHSYKNGDTDVSIEVSLGPTATLKYDVYDYLESTDEILGRTLTINVMSQSTEIYIDSSAIMFEEDGSFIIASGEMPLVVNVKESSYQYYQIFGRTGLFIISGMINPMQADYDYELSEQEIVQKIDKKFIPETFYNLNTTGSSEAATAIKPNTFATEIRLNDDDEFVFDFSSLNNNAAQSFGYFDANVSTPSSISFVDTNGDSISVASNISEFESAEYMCTFMMVNYAGENRVFATFAKMQ